MLKHISKLAMDILPSVIATILGAYIVNHYINTKPDAPIAAAVTAADPNGAEPRSVSDKSGSAKPLAKSAETNIPKPGVTAKGISERGMFERTAAEKPTVIEKSAEKPADKPEETASIPVETRSHPAPREKAVARSVPALATPVIAAPVVVGSPNLSPAPVEAATVPDDHRDANELARAAIERLRGTGDSSPRPPQAARVPDSPRVAAGPVLAAPVIVSAPAVRPLPPPIMVSTPPSEGPDAGPARYPAAAVGDSRRPTPPADIPESRPLDLRAEAVEPVRREHTSVAQDMLLAAKSVFHAVLPRQLEPRPD